MKKKAERGQPCLKTRWVLKLADEKPFISITAFESEYKVSIALTENSSRFNFFQSLMKIHLSTLSNALEKSDITAHESRLANRSGVIAFFDLRIVVCICLPVKYACWWFLQHWKGLFKPTTDYMGKNFCIYVHENDRAKILYCYGIFRFREQFDYC